jgi:hypothetical protein
MPNVPPVQCGMYFFVNVEMDVPWQGTMPDQDADFEAYEDACDARRNETMELAHAVWDEFEAKCAAVGIVVTRELANAGPISNGETFL